VQPDDAHAHCVDQESASEAGRDKDFVFAQITEAMLLNF